MEFVLFCLGIAIDLFVFWLIIFSSLRIKSNRGNIKMSPEPDVSQLDYGEDNKIFGSKKNDADVKTTVKSLDTKAAKEGAAIVAVVSSQMAAPRKQREIHNQSSPTAALLESFVAPSSPASSSTSTTQTNSADTTFEPTIDMMVNDFDDEHTLNEEEALAALEQQDPHDEIATLKEESEMPIEELLAKYRSMPPVPAEPSRKKAKKSSKHNKVKRANGHGHCTPSVQTLEEEAEKLCEVTRSDEIAIMHTSDVIVIESGDEEVSSTADQQASENNENDKDAHSTTAEEIADTNMLVEKVKPLRSHLLDLYPEESFTSVVGVEAGKAIPLEMFYGEDDEDYDDELDDEEADSDYVKKTIMVGPLYQAIIPDGLSQYGDVLPYENEDKLIWEPSQVSESEVEEYLLKAREIKPNLMDDETIEMTSSDDTGSGAAINVNKVTAVCSESICGTEETANPPSDNSKMATVQSSSSEGEQSSVVKDNEQSLHLLVQCGYDFKEALRRKRLNAVPLTGSMSLWSEEECQKFEEGIQKFGKDFLKIRQNQVRTRTMRELVQFYYLWKKSERRDHEFANADTVDHMDIFLNEGGDYSPNANAAIHTATVSTASAFGTRKINTANAPKNFSIMMTGNNMSTSNSPSPQSNNSTVATAASPASGSKTSVNRRRSTNVATVGNLLRNIAGDNQNVSSTK